MVLLEPFSKLPFWSFNHPLGGSLHWIHFFQYSSWIASIKTYYNFDSAKSHMLIYFLFWASHIQSSLSFPWAEDRSSTVCSASLIACWPWSSCQNQWLHRRLPHCLCCSVCGWHYWSLCSVPWWRVFSHVDLLFPSQLFSIPTMFAILRLDKSWF